jgi:hypothetical protein
LEGEPLLFHFRQFELQSQFGDAGEALYGLKSRSRLPELALREGEPGVALERIAFGVLGKLQEPGSRKAQGHTDRRLRQ